MSSQNAAQIHWRAATLIGVGLICLPLLGLYIDVSTHFEVQWISDNLDVLMVGLLIGIVVSFGGCVGWAKHRDKAGRVSMAIWVFLVPWFAVAIGYFIDGLNVHISAPIVMLIAIPALLLAFVLSLMAAVAK